MNNVELPFIREMFDAIAPKYDFLNRSLSLYQDVIWRRRAIASLKLGNGRGKKMLDVACGTCDMAIEAVRRTQGRLSVTATDFSFNMLALGKTKVAKEPHGKAIALAQGNGLALPSFEEAYDAVTIAFGIRNIMDRKGALEEFHRCLKEEGRVAVLELTTPTNKLLRGLYLLYFQKVLPIIGGLFSKNKGAYSYLPDSVLKFPSHAEFKAIMTEAGFTDVHARPMTFGIVTLFTGKKG
ncbi:ubiquinone/menaquinone biosynthesis C-methyltransferase UbiE [Desulfoluna limicola]|uniref:Demethylmenaquinone methyltransferase n=1 Tax=Desulfoluna limicola TaxID=2810562 RepID=A0ABM7PLP7_9BACT|nr:bifunctional demethylmenaquinone methyltransferase/2-methoxy-6-polyprenyl-1,4-benzoquinol methylase UbiE [Desulfoluna limicola]BCS98450.1 ubiquinone/menaquinone biosynthesis C-methyltransferase UbiE [Desulfoluna limicola]